jgi:hypothetical protein
MGTLYAAYMAIHSTLIIHKDERLYYKRKTKILQEIKELLIHLENDSEPTKETIAALKELARYLKTY